MKAPGSDTLHVTFRGHTFPVEVPLEPAGRVQLALSVGPDPLLLGKGQPGLGRDKVLPMFDVVAGTCLKTQLPFAIYQNEANRSVAARLMQRLRAGERAVEGGVFHAGARVDQEDAAGRRQAGKVERAGQAAGEP